MPFSIRPDQKRLKLYELRVERGLSLRRVEALTGIAQAQLSHYERGLREPLVGNALILAKFFRSTVEELFSYASI